MNPPAKVKQGLCRRPDWQHLHACRPQLERCVVLCRPQGTLRCSIRAVWLQHVQPELDGMTDLSCMSMGKSAASSDLVMAEQVS